MGDLDSECVQMFLNGLTGHSSPTTVKNVWTTIRIMRNSALAWKYAVGELHVDLPRSRRLRMRCYTGEEVKRMLANARAADQAFFWLAAETGLRAGELIALRVAEVDLKSHSNRVKTKLETRTR